MLHYVIVWLFGVGQMENIGSFGAFSLKMSDGSELLCELCAGKNKTVKLCRAEWVHHHV